MKSILKKASWLLIAQIIGRLLGFFYMIYLARSLGVDNFGLFSVGIAYFSIIASVADLGINRYLIRELSKNSLKIWNYFWNVSLIKLVVICIFFGIFSIILYGFDPDKTRVSIILLSFLAVFPLTLAATLDGIFIALQKFKYSAIASILSSVSTIILGYLLVNNGYGIMGAMSALIFGQTFYALFAFVFFYNLKKLKFSPVNLGEINKILRGAFPYGVLAIMGLIFFRIDIVLLSYLKGNYETGIYSAGFRFLEALVFVPNILNTVLFPTFAKLHDDNQADIKGITLKSIKLMVIAGIAVALGYIMILPLIIKYYLPGYALTVDVIRILALAIPFMFIHVSVSAVLLSTDKYLKQIIMLSTIPLFFNISSNLIFIPIFGFWAAAWNTVVSDFMSALIILIFIRRKVFKNA